MNLKLSAITLGLATVLIPVAHADIVLHYPLGGTDNVCEHISGAWSGTGKVSEGISCTYTGDGKLEYNPGDQHNLKVVNLHLISQSSWPCPKEETLNYTGDCLPDGTIIIHTEDKTVSLDGSFTDPTHAHVFGTVTFTVPVIGKISPHADILLHK